MRKPPGAGQNQAILAVMRPGTAPSTKGMGVYKPIDKNIDHYWSKGGNSGCQLKPFISMDFKIWGCLSPQTGKKTRDTADDENSIENIKSRGRYQCKRRIHIAPTPKLKDVASTIQYGNYATGTRPPPDESSYG